MSFIYLYEHGASVSVQGNRIVIEQKKANMIRSVPIEGVESVCIIGEVAFTSHCIKAFLERGIQLTWLSATGSFFGKLAGTEHQNILREIAQFGSREDETFCLSMAANWISSKIKNQRTLLRRYARFREIDVAGEIEELGAQIQALDGAKSIDVLMGHEGIAAKTYFAALSKLTEKVFAFEGRSRRPPKDPFNALLSFAYTLLMYEFFAVISGKGLHPYIGNMHAPRNGHPALCSDLMEEWRPIIADSVVMYVISKGIIQYRDFEKPDGRGGVYLKPDAAKRFIAEYETKVRSKAQYLSYADFAVSFRRAIELQVDRYIKAVEAHDPGLYCGVVIR